MSNICRSPVPSSGICCFSHPTHQSDRSWSWFNYYGAYSNLRIQSRFKEIIFFLLMCWARSEKTIIWPDGQVQRRKLETVKRADGQGRDPTLVRSFADGKWGGEKDQKRGKGELEAGMKMQEGKNWSWGSWSQKDTLYLHSYLLHSAQINHQIH